MNGKHMRKRDFLGSQSIFISSTNICWLDISHLSPMFNWNSYHSSNSLFVSTFISPSNLVTCSWIFRLQQCWNIRQMQRLIKSFWIATEISPCPRVHWLPPTFGLTAPVRIWDARIEPSHPFHKQPKVSLENDQKRAIC